MGTHDRLLDTIESIQSASLDPGAWPGALARMIELCGGWHASLERFDLENGRHDFWHGYGMEPEMIEAYIGHCESRPAHTWTRRPAAPSLFPARHIVSRAPAHAEPFYAATDFLDGTDMQDFAAGIVGRASGRETVLTVRKRPRADGIGTQDMRLLHALLPHIGHAVATADRIAGLEAQTQALAGAIDTGTLQAAFDLTRAEARLAQALVAGQSPIAYARASGCSANTVYTHLKRIKDKTHTASLPGLIHALNTASLHAVTSEGAADSGLTEDLPGAGRMQAGDAYSYEAPTRSRILRRQQG